MNNLLSLTAIALTVAAISPSVNTADAFDKRYPSAAPHAAEYREKEAEIARANTAKPKEKLKKLSEKERQPGLYSTEEYEAAMPDYLDPFVDGPQLECTACLSVADVVANRFSKLKTEFRVNMENVKPYHVDAALDELCSREQQFIGLLIPNVTNHMGERVDKQFRTDRMEKEDELLANAKKDWEAKNKNKKQSVSKADEEKQRKRREKRNKGKSAQEIQWLDEEDEWRKYGLDEYAIARRKRLRLPFTIWPEYADEREIRKKTKGGIPLDVSVLRNVKIHTEWQRMCDEAVTRMEDFGLMKVFRGSRSFNMCPMCTNDNPLAQGRNHNPGGVSKDASEANAKSDAELAKAEKDRLKKEKLAALKAKRGGADLGDDDEDAQFIRGKADEYEL